MKPSARRKVERKIQAIMKSAGDNCSICNRAFPNNSKTFGGTIEGGAVVLAGDCCFERMKVIVLSGVYIDSRIAALLPLEQGPSNDEGSSGSLSDSIKNLQSYIGSRTDDLKADLMKKGGIRARNTTLDLSDNQWKEDDAGWFQDNPGRSHRLRSMFPGEGSSFPDGFSSSSAPPDHEVEILVRQVEVGKRIRTPFFRNSKIDIPDLEPIIHALFDIAASEHNGRGMVSASEVADLAIQYAEFATKKPS